MAELKLKRSRLPLTSIPAGRSFPVLSQVSRIPRLYVRDGLLPAEEIEDLLRACADPERLGVDTRRSDMTGTSFELPVDAHAVAASASARIEGLLGEPTDVGDTLRYRTYEPGESHPPHVDNYVIGGCDLVATAMLCLTDVDGGGCTAFPLGAPPVSVEPRRGRLIVWLNCLVDGTRDPLSRHEGQAVTAGRKTTVTAFVYRPPTESDLVRRGPAGVGS